MVLGFGGWDVRMRMSCEGQTCEYGRVRAAVGWDLERGADRGGGLAGMRSGE